MQAFYQHLHSPLGRTNLLGARFVAAFGYYIGAGTMAKVEEARVFKLRIGLCNSVRADHQFLRKGANTRKDIAIAENRCFNSMTNLLHHLRVERMTG